MLKITLLPIRQPLFSLQFKHLKKLTTFNFTINKKKIFVVICGYLVNVYDKNKILIALIR